MKVSETEGFELARAGKSLVNLKAQGLAETLPELQPNHPGIVKGAHGFQPRRKGQGSSRPI